MLPVVVAPAAIADGGPLEVAGRAQAVIGPAAALAALVAIAGATGADRAVGPAADPAVAVPAGAALAVGAAGGVAQGAAVVARRSAAVRAVVGAVLAAVGVAPAVLAAVDPDATTRAGPLRSQERPRRSSPRLRRRPRRSPRLRARIRTRSPRASGASRRCPAQGNSHVVRTLSVFAASGFFCGLQSLTQSLAPSRSKQACPPRIATSDV